MEIFQNPILAKLFDRIILAGKGLARCDVPVSSPSPSEPLVRFSLKRLTR
jgi:hypothetical protein